MVKKIMAFVFSVLMASSVNTVSVDVDSYAVLSKNTDEVEAYCTKTITNPSMWNAPLQVSQLQRLVRGLLKALTITLIL